MLGGGHICPPGLNPAQSNQLQQHRPSYSEFLIPCVSKGPAPPHKLRDLYSLQKDAHFLAASLTKANYTLYPSRHRNKSVLLRSQLFVDKCIKNMNKFIKLQIGIHNNIYMNLRAILLARLPPLLRRLFLKGDSESPILSREGSTCSRFTSSLI